MAPVSVEETLMLARMDCRWHRVVEEGERAGAVSSLMAGKPWQSSAGLAV